MFQPRFSTSDDSTGYSGKLIVVEGINGSGKSSIISAAEKTLRRYVRNVCVYKFPDRRTKIGKKLDKYLKKEIEIPSKYDVLDLFARNRLEFRTQIYKDLYSGSIVICDRYTYSAVAYHIPLHVNALHQIESYSKIISYFDVKMPQPDITFLIDGTHLEKRSEDAERFHYTETKARMMHMKLSQVISITCYQYVVIENKEGLMSEAVDTMIDMIGSLYD